MRRTRKVPIMQRKTIKTIFYLLAALSFAGALISFPFLPDTIPGHWNFAGKIDGYNNKISIFFIGATPLVLMFVLDKLPLLDPRKANYVKHQKAYDVTQMSMVLFMIVVTWLSVLGGLGVNFRSNVLIPALVGILFLIIGNYMPTITPNFFMGIKNPWTLSDDVIWKKTHKAGGYAFAICGVLFLITAFIPYEVMGFLVAVSVLIMVIGLNVYSFSLFLEQEKKDIK